MDPDPDVAGSCELWRALQRDAFTRGYSDVEYNFAVSPRGDIIEGRGWDRASGANGTTSSNQHLWAICYLAGPGVPLTDRAKSALLWLTQECSRRKARCTTVTPHRNVYGVSTFCPGDECAAFCPELQSRLFETDNQPAPPPNVPPVPHDEDEEMIRVLCPTKPDLALNGSAGVAIDSESAHNLPANTKEWHVSAAVYNKVIKAFNVAV